MRQLFVKIFISVLLTVLLTLAGGFAIAVWILPPPSFESTDRPRGGPQADFGEIWRFRMTDVLQTHMRAVGELLARGDQAAAFERMDRLPSVWGASSYLLDDAGGVLHGGDVPAELREFAKRASGTGQLQLGGDSDDPIIVAAPLRNADGEACVLVAQSAQPPPRPEPPLLLWVIVLRLAPIVITLGLVCYFLARYITGPVLKLRGALRRFGEGELDQRVGASVGRRRDEIGELARDFDDMAERIATLLEAQRRLLQDISHELRSPLARLRVALELARQRDGASVPEALNRVEREAERLDVLIGELLTLTRLESQSDHAERSPIDLVALVREVVENAQFEAHGGTRSVQLVECAPCIVAAHHELLRRALENVVRNALVYTKEETSVEIRPQIEAEHALIRIRDHGPGVPAAELEKIFRPFYRVSHARERQTGGVGLGLAIVERAVRSHGGSVTANNHPDGGLVVEMRIPRIYEPDPPASVV